jgi:hypothetical protein
MGAFYTAWAANIRDSQMWQGDPHPAGSVPDTVPHTFGAYPSDPAWGTAYPGVVHSTWRMLGDTRIAADHYPNLQLYVTFMMTQVNKTGIGKLYQCVAPSRAGGPPCPPRARFLLTSPPPPPHAPCPSPFVFADPTATGAPRAPSPPTTSPPVWPS